MGDRKGRFVQEDPSDVPNTPDIALWRLEQQYSLSQATELFTKERQAKGNLKEACYDAERRLADGSLGLTDSHLSTLDQATKVAIVAYTLENPNVYRDFNEQSRELTTNTWKNFPYKGLWLLLNKAILSHGNINQYVTVYRGITKEVQPSQSQFCFRQVTSTSKSKAKALEFKNGVKGTLFILTISRGLNITSLSVAKTEQEILVPFFDVFSVNKTEDTNISYNIYLEATRGPV